MILKRLNGPDIDTDKLGDVLAAVLEKLDEVHAFFTNLQVPYFLRFFHNDRGSGCQSCVDPKLQPEQVAAIQVSQCIAFIERTIPSCSVVLAKREEKEEWKGDSP